MIKVSLYVRNRTILRARSARATSFDGSCEAGGTRTPAASIVVPLCS